MFLADYFGKYREFFAVFKIFLKIFVEFEIFVEKFLYRRNYFRDITAVAVENVEFLAFSKPVRHKTVDEAQQSRLLVFNAIALCLVEHQLHCNVDCLVVAHFNVVIAVQVNFAGEIAENELEKRIDCADVEIMITEENRTQRL